jgi:hypothetical protein
LIFFSGLWKSWKKTNNPEALRFQPLLAYSISRNLKKETALFGWATKLLGFDVKKFDTKEAKTMDNLGLIAKWVILNRRVKQDDTAQ